MNEVSELIIRNIFGNIICKIRFNGSNLPIVSIVGRGCKTEILIFDDKTVAVNYAPGVRAEYFRLVEKD